MRGGEFAKRVIDAVLAGVGLLLLLPVFCLIAVAIKVDSRGSAIYSQVRVGRHGQHFRLHKFRTMVAGADRSQRLTPSNDLRMTRLGPFLRRTNLDELPQLLNVLRGEMSLVGPRPEVPEFVDLNDPRWIESLSVRPGMTAPVTIAHRREGDELASFEDPVAGYREVVLPRKLDMNVQYVRTRSLRGDVRSVFDTLADIVQGHRQDEEVRGRNVVVRVTPIRRLAFFLTVDAALVGASAALAVLLRFDFVLPHQHFPLLVVTALSTVGAMLAVLVVSGAYRASWSFIGLRDIVRLALAVLGSTVILAAIVFSFHGRGPLESFPRSVVLIQAPITFCALSAFRLSRRAYRMYRRGNSRMSGTPTILVGAGEAGEQVLKSIQLQGRNAPYAVVGFVDDDPLAHRTSIHGTRVLGPVSALEEQIKRYNVGAVILTVASASSPFLRDVVKRSRDAGVETIRIVPPLSEIVDGRVSVQMTREVSLEDLLGREEVTIDPDGIKALIQGKVVLVTGGAGTIGSELCRQVSRLQPRRLVVCDVDESRLHDVCVELRRQQESATIEEALVDVRDHEEVLRLFRQHRFDIVFHAAAYKHVPMMEKYPIAALSVNVLGTANVADVAASCGCARFVLISTDKAVEPSSIMGASKRLAEMVLFQGRESGRASFPTAHSAVRFGNVIGSRGSVIPAFKAALRNGGPLLVTHPEMERYFMMTSEAVSLVLQAASLGRGGEIFILDMGKPVRILDVAREFIRLNGLDPDVDIPITFTGIRPGEKLREVLHYPHEKLLPTAHARIMKTKAAPGDGQTHLLLQAVEAVVSSRDDSKALDFLLRTFPSLHTGRRWNREPDGPPTSRVITVGGGTEERR